MPQARRLNTISVAGGSDVAGRRIFVAYPWNLYSSRASYKKAYTSLEKALEVKFLFAEERISSGHILDKIKGMIQDASFGIYDVSTWNANVTLEYGIAAGLGAKSFIAFNPDKTALRDVPTDIRGYDRLQYSDLDDLSDKVTRLVRDELGVSRTTRDPFEADRIWLILTIAATPGLTVRELSDRMGRTVDYIQLLLRQSSGEWRTEGATRATRYFPSRRRRKPLAATE